MLLFCFFFSNKCKQNCHSQLTINRLWEFPFYRITVLQSTKTFAFKTCTFTHTIKQFFCRYIYSTFLSLLHYSLSSPCFLFSSHASFRHCFIRRFAQCDVTVPEFGIRLSGIRPWTSQSRNTTFSTIYTNFSNLETILHSQITRSSGCIGLFISLYKDLELKTKDFSFGPFPLGFPNPFPRVFYRICFMALVLGFQNNVGAICSPGR